LQQLARESFFLLDTQMHVRAEVQCGCKENPIQDLNRECHARLTKSGLVGMRTENKFCWLKLFLLLLRVVINFNIYIYKNTAHGGSRQKKPIYMYYTRRHAGQETERAWLIPIG
jgi:hypothetical protein